MTLVTRETETSKYKVGDYFYNFNSYKCHIVSFTNDNEINLVVCKYFSKNSWKYFVEEVRFLKYNMYEKLL